MPAKKRSSKAIASRSRSKKKSGSRSVAKDSPNTIEAGVARITRSINLLEAASTETRLAKRQYPDKDSLGHDATTPDEEHQTLKAALADWFNSDSATISNICRYNFGWIISGMR